MKFISHRMSNSDRQPSALNIKLKTHSLNALDIPLETCAGFDPTFKSFHNDHRLTMAGSVDQISEIPEDRVEMKSHLCHYSSDKDFELIQSQTRRMNAFRIPATLHDSVARLRRNAQLNGNHQSSLPTVHHPSERKTRKSIQSWSIQSSSPSIDMRSIPKFALRPLPSHRKPLFTSLPEIRSFIRRHGSQKLKNSDEDRPAVVSSWEKSGSWSWKSILGDSERKKEQKRPVS